MSDRNPRPSLETAGTGHSLEAETIPAKAATTESRDHAPRVNQAITREDGDYPSGLKLFLIMASTFSSLFLVSLDRMIITTAIPQITNDFKSATDIGWYGSGFYLTTCAFQMLYGKLYSFFSIKVVFLAAVFLFEVGSALSGAAPNSPAFIVGRVIAGMGGAGITGGTLVVLVYCVPLHKRPMYQGIFGALFGISSVLGPLIGGALTSKATWRWCFYINLPLGGIAMLVTLFFMEIPERESTKIPTKEKLAQLDFYGTALLIPGTICLILALQWGGVTYPWSNGRIVALIVLAALLLLGFMLVQVLLPKTATIAPRIFMQRSILAGFFSTLCMGCHSVLFFYYLPLWFQAIQGLSAVDSGIRTIPLIVSMVVANILAGMVAQRIGYYVPSMIIGICIMSVGAGLLTTLEIDTEAAKLVGYQILYGFGMGLVSQAPNLAAQTVLAKADVPIGASLMVFSQLLTGAIFLPVGQSILYGDLIDRLASVPGFRPDMLQNSGATSLVDVSEPLRTTILVAYNESLRQLFLAGLIIVCVSILGALAMEWRSVKKNPAKAQKIEEDCDLTVLNDKNAET